jgi:hypothetical protein
MIRSLVRFGQRALSFCKACAVRVDTFCFREAIQISVEEVFKQYNFILSF